MEQPRRTVIVKVDATKFVKYVYVNNLPSFVKFLNRDFPNWRFMNVFDRTTGNQIANFTKNNPPLIHL